MYGVHCASYLHHVYQLQCTGVRRTLELVWTDYICTRIWIFWLYTVPTQLRICISYRHLLRSIMHMTYTPSMRPLYCVLRTVIAYGVCIWRILRVWDHCSAYCAQWSLTEYAYESRSYRAESFSTFRSSDATSAMHTDMDILVIYCTAVPQSGHTP